MGQGVQEEKQQKASRHPGEALCVAQATLRTLNHSCLAFISQCACTFMNTACWQRCNLTQKYCSLARLFPVGMRRRKLCLITYKIQPEMLAAKGTNDSLHKNARIQSSKHALTEECCPGGWRMAAQQSGCAATPSLSVPCQGRSAAGGRRALPKSWGML